MIHHSINYSNILELIKNAKKIAKEHAIKEYLNKEKEKLKTLERIASKTIVPFLKRRGFELTLRSLGEYVVSNDEKAWSLDFLFYVLEKRSELDIRIFDERDHPEILKFVRNKVYTAFLDRFLFRDLFDEKDMEIRRKYCSFVKKIKSKRDYYILDSYKLPLNHFEYPVFFHKLGLKELPQHVLAQIKGKDVIDGGAYIGDSALILEELSPRTIYAFEALKENFDMLNKTIQLNGLRNVVPLKKGLGKKEGNMKIMPFGSASFLAEIFGEDAGESVEMISVDDFVNETGAHVGLIKLDVEGSELDVLTGAKETIKEYKPVLVVSVYHRGQDFFEIPKLIKELNPSYQMKFLNLNRASATFERVILAFTND